MAKVPLPTNTDSNIPDDWELVSPPAEQKEPEQKTTRKFKRWDSGNFPATSSGDFPVTDTGHVSAAGSGPSSEHEIPVPADIHDLSEWLGLDVGEQDLGPRVFDPQKTQEVSQMLLDLMTKLPPQFVPPLPELAASLQQGSLQVFTNGEVDLSGIQAFLQERMGWTIHRFQTFCKPLLPQLKSKGYSLRRIDFGAMELKGISRDPSSIVSEHTDGSDGSTTKEPSPTKVTAQRIERISSPSVEVPTLAAVAAEEEAEPLSKDAKEAVLVFILGCAKRSALRSLLDMEVLEEYLDIHLPDMWENKTFHLQPLWHKLHEIPHVSEALILSMFSEMEKHQKEVPYGLKLPKEVARDLSKKAAASPVSMRSSEANTVPPMPQAKPRVAVERIHAPHKTKRKTSPVFLVMGCLLMVVGGYYLLFVANAGPSMQGENIDPQRYAAVMPLSKATYHKPSFTLYARVLPVFMQWEPTQRVRAIYALHRFVQQKENVRVLKILRPNGELYASLGRMN